MVWQFAVTIAALYLVGSIPTGYIAARLLRGIDLRNWGSRATGATNSLRALGRGPFLLVLVTDILKGWIPVLLIWYLSQAFGASEGESHNLQVAGGLAAIVGHDFSIFIGLRGGRGVATAMGVYAALVAPLAFGLVPIAIFVLVAFRYMSLMSIITVPLGGLALLSLAIAGEEPYAKAVFGGLASGMILFRHIGNVTRLLKGTEPKIGEGGGHIVSGTG